MEVAEGTLTNLTLEDLKKKIDAGPSFKEDEAFIYLDDHWQDGAGFIGPMAFSTDNVTSASEVQERAAANQTIQKGVRKNFTSENMLKEVALRKRDGVVGKEPLFTPEASQIRHRPGAGDEEEHQVPEEDQQRIDEMYSALLNWWRGKKIHRIFKDFAFDLLVHTKSNLRGFIPKGRLTDKGKLKVRVENPCDALEHLFAEVVKRDRATVWTDPDTQYEISVVHFPVEDNVRQTEYIEVSYLDYDQLGQPTAEGSSGRPKTVLSHISKGKEVGAGVVTSQPIDLRGNLMLFEGEVETFITQQMKEQQRALNTASTEMRIVNNDRGFPETVFLNAQPPAMIKMTEHGPKPIPLETYVRSPGAVGHIQGTKVVKRGPAGEETVDYKDPSVEVIEAANVENYVDEMQQRRISILRQAKQLHVQLIDDASASGESRIQALVDFLWDLGEFKAVLDSAGTWLLETAWNLALEFTGRSGRDNDIRIIFDTKINVPYLPAGLIDAILKQVSSGLRSRETAMTDLGIDDVHAEKDRIARELPYELQSKKLQAEIIKALTESGISIEPAARFVKISEEEAKTLSRQDIIDEATRAEQAGRVGGTNGQIPPVPEETEEPATV